MRVGVVSVRGVSSCVSVHGKIRLSKKYGEKTIWFHKIVPGLGVWGFWGLSRIIIKKPPEARNPPRGLFSDPGPSTVNKVGGQVSRYHR